MSTEMTSDTLVYSREEVIQEVTSFYQFLTTLHVPESAVHYPPPDGWPDITKERYAWLKKDDEVIELMRRLPFISRKDDQTSHEIYPLTAVVHYNSAEMHDAISDNELFKIHRIDPVEAFTLVPSYLLTLAEEAPGGTGNWLFIDTRRGTITVYNPGAGPSGKGTPADEASHEDWQKHDTFKICGFFRSLIERYRKLELMPMNVYEVRENHFDENDKLLLRIYEDCEWPSPTYRKHECMKRIDEASDMIREDPYRTSNELAYVRDEVVREVTAFYEFLTTLHISKQAIKYPPPGGWPEITKERYAWMKKDDEVIELMRYLPYIDEEGQYQIYPNTAVIDYVSPKLRGEIDEQGTGNKDDVDPLEGYTLVPSYLLSLAKETSGATGYWIFINTRKGHITLYDAMNGARGRGRVKLKGFDRPSDGGPHEEWPEHDTYSVQDFFSVIKEQYMKLEVIPDGVSDVIEWTGEFDKPIVEIYHDCGWPTANFRRDECFARTLAAEEKRRQTLEAEQKRRRALKAEEEC